MRRVARVGFQGCIPYQVIDKLYAAPPSPNSSAQMYWQRICKDGWAYRKFSDGVCQWCPPYRPDEKCRTNIYIERVHPSRTWNIVDRSDSFDSRRVDPPVVCGPFKTLSGAKTAMKLIQAAGG